MDKIRLVGGSNDGRIVNNPITDCLIVRVKGNYEQVIMEDVAPTKKLIEEIYIRDLIEYNVFRLKSSISS